MKFLDCLAEQPQVPEEGHGLDQTFPLDPQGMYVMLVMSVVVCIAGCHNVFSSVGCVKRKRLE